MDAVSVWHKAGSSVFNLEIFMSKIAPHSGSPITGEVDEIMKKIEQD